MSSSAKTDYFLHLINESWHGRFYRTSIRYPFLRFLTGNTFLDVGCGIGRMLSTGSSSSSLGLDINASAITHCRQKNLNVRLINPDGSFPVSSSSFDVVICDQVLEHIADPSFLLLEISRVLCTNGKFIVGVPCAKGYYSDPDHKIFYQLSNLVSTINSFGFFKSYHFYFPFPFPIFGRFFSFQYLYVVFRKS